MQEKIIVALVSAMASFLVANISKSLTIEGRLDAIERSVQRIEVRLFPHQESAK